MRATGILRETSLVAGRLQQQERHFCRGRGRKTPPRERDASNWGRPQLFPPFWPQPGLRISDRRGRIVDAEYLPLKDILINARQRILPDAALLSRRFEHLFHRLARYSGRSDEQFAGRNAALTTEYVVDAIPPRPKAGKGNRQRLWGGKLPNTPRAPMSVLGHREPTSRPSKATIVKSRNAIC